MTWGVPLITIPSLVHIISQAELDLPPFLTVSSNEHSLMMQFHIRHFPPVSIFVPPCGSSVMSISGGFLHFIRRPWNLTHPSIDQSWHLVGPEPIPEPD